MIASIVVSCKQDESSSPKLDPNKVPLQRVTDMSVVQTGNGAVVNRLEAPLMEHYETDTAAVDQFPEGLSLYGYTDDGMLESIIVADRATHIKPNRTAVGKEEIWYAFGNVIVHNIIEKQTLETDTLYWDRTINEIYTHCYVKMYSPDGFMQGYGMRSDERARNARLHSLFNSYALVVRDTTAVVIDSVNFIGPFPDK